MGKKIISVLLCGGLLIGNGLAVSPSIEVDGIAAGVTSQVYHGTTYVPLRETAEALCPGAEVSWENGRGVVRTSVLDLKAGPGEGYIEANGRAIYTQQGVKAESGRTMVPVRALAQAVGAEVHWDGASGTVSLTRGCGAIMPQGDAFYNGDDLYWLSRIISAESQGEVLSGKIAVGNVILNRVKSSEFPNTIYDVIFDQRWGGQFTPVRNGTVYQEPTAESVQAAKLVLEGANTVGDSLYFLAPALATNFWVMENRPLVKKIGVHWFYA